MKFCLNNTKEVCEVPCLLGLTIANRLYPAVLLQFLFTVVFCVFAWLTVQTSTWDQLNWAASMLIDRAIWKSYFLSLFDNLYQNIQFYISEAHRLRISRLVFDFSAICYAMTARNYNSRRIRDHASRARYKFDRNSLKKSFKFRVEIKIPFLVN